MLQFSNFSIFTHSTFATDLLLLLAQQIWQLAKPSFLSHLFFRIKPPSSSTRDRLPTRRQRGSQMTPLPFPSTGGGGGGTEEYDSKMRIDIPREADGTAAAAAPPKKGGGLQPAHAPLSTVNNKEDAAASAHARGGSAPNTWLHHPRQPLASSDSYFPSTPGGSQQHPHQSAQRTPGGSLRGHSRQGSIVAGSAPQQQQQPNHATLSRKQAANMSLSLSAGGLPSSSDQATGQPAANGSVANLHDSAVGDYPVDGGFGGGGPPSPSTLTDIILGLHSTLYGGKRLPEEVREMVQRYYDYDAGEFIFFLFLDTRRLAD